MICLKQSFLVGGIDSLFTEIYGTSIAILTLSRSMDDIQWSFYRKKNICYNCTDLKSKIIPSNSFWYGVFWEFDTNRNTWRSASWK